jgi:3-oxoadipate enol-lactonase
VTTTMKSVDGVAYDVRGADTGTPLVLIRPAGGSSALWGRFRDELAEKRTVVSPDHHGTGASSAAPISITTEELARDVLAVAADAGLSRFDLFGISLGGMVATWVAALAPERVRRLVLASTPVRGRGVGSLRSIEEATAGLKLAACLVRPEGKVLTCLTKGLLSSGFRKRHPLETRMRIEEARAEKTSRRGILTLLGAAARHDGSAALARITASVLVVLGGEDLLLPLESQRELLADLHDARFEVVPGAGHSLTMERPEQMAALTAAFLDAPEPVAAPSSTGSGNG